MLKLSIDYFQRLSLSDNGLSSLALEDQATLELPWFKGMNTIIDKYKDGDQLCPSHVHQRLSTKVYKNCSINVKRLWKCAIGESPKLELYNALKPSFGREKYLDLQDIKLRQILSKIRLSAHKLAIETGRYTVPPTPRSSRFCLVCKGLNSHSCVESEEHFIFDCSLYDDLRRKLSPDNTALVMERDIKSLLQCNLPDLGRTFNISMFLLKAYKRRQDTLDTIKG